MQELLARRYLFYRFFTSLWFISAVWLYFYRLFITDQQVGLLDGIVFAIALLAEIPSSALADKFGRSKIVRFGQILAGCGIIITVTGNGFSQFFIGQAIQYAGIAFASGADEALFFQKLNYGRDSSNWKKLVTRGGQVALFGSIIALIVGGFLYQINPRAPWFLNGLAFIVAALIIWPVKDVVPEGTKQSFLKDTKDYIANITEGFKQFMLPELNPYLLLIIIVQGLFYTFGWGLLKLILLSRFGFSPLLGAFAIASCSLITVGLLGFMHKNAERFSERNIIMIISLTAIVSLLLAVANIGFLGYFVILMLYSGEYLLHPFISTIINNRASEKQRATVLSVSSFLRMLPYVVLAPIIGYLNTHHHLDYFLIGWAILAILAILFYLLRRRVVL